MKDAKPFVCVVLIEHTKEFTWNKNELRKLYYENHSWLRRYNDTISDTWMIDDVMTLKTTFEVKNLEKTFN
jgi:hypothetical protein